MPATLMFLSVISLHELEHGVLLSGFSAVRRFAPGFEGASPAPAPHTDSDWIPFTAAA